MKTKMLVIFQYGRQRFRELWECMQNDDDDKQGNTPDSQVRIKTMMMKKKT